MCIPSLENGNKILEINKVIFLRNLSDTPDREFRFKIGGIHKVWKDNLRSDKKYYMPIHFHSHPKIDMSSLTSGDYLETSALIHEPISLSTSEQDQETSLNLEIGMRGANFLIPSALILKSDVAGDQLIIGFYGGRIAPTDFIEYMMELTGKTFEETVKTMKNWIDEDPSRKWLLIILGFVIGGTVIYYHKQSMPILSFLVLFLFVSDLIPIIKQSSEALPNYFAVLRAGEIIIQIPEYVG